MSTKGVKNSKQQWLCRDCKHQFLENDNFVKMGINTHVIVSALNLYFERLSIYKTKRQLAKILGIRISKTTIWKWVRKYSRLVESFIDSLEPKLSGGLQIDETTINYRDKDGLLKWFWQAIDPKTRFLVANHISDDRNSEEVIKLFRKVLDVARKPKQILTNELWVYEKAYKKIFWTRYKAKRPQYIRGLGIRSGLQTRLKDCMGPQRQNKGCKRL